MGEQVFGLNLKNPNSNNSDSRPAAKMAVFSLASDFGCQVQMTNIEQSLLDVLGMIDLVYWQMVSSAPLPDSYDIAVVEGAVCTQEHRDLLKQIRDTASIVIALGACATTGGIPSLASTNLDERMKDIYGGTPKSCGAYCAPCPISDIIAVDFSVFGCPIEPNDFVRVLQKALLGGIPASEGKSLCGSCRIHEDECFFARGEMCMGLVTADGCNARCIREGRPCTGCRGLAKDSNIASAQAIVAKYGFDQQAFMSRIELFNMRRVIAHDKDIH